VSASFLGRRPRSPNASIGQTLYANAVYDDQSGSLETGSFMDYCMRRADSARVAKAMPRRIGPREEARLGFRHPLVLGFWGSGRLTATEAVAKLRKKELSPLELVEAAASRIEAVEPKINKP
jgi:hypothetical protein